MTRRILLVLPCTLILACGGAPKPAPQSQPASRPVVKADPNAVPRVEQWRAKRPAQGPSAAPVIPTFQQAKLPNGLTVLVSERHDLPLVDVRVAMRAGTMAEPKGKGGLADLTYEVMLEGAGKLDGVALARAFSDLGSKVAVYTDREGAFFYATVLSRHAGKALGLLSQVVKRPRLARADFQRRQKRMVADMVRRQGRPGYLAWREARLAVFGEGHAHGRGISGTLKSLRGLRLADARRFYKRSVGPGAAAVIFSGDITLAQATALAQKHLGGWRGKATAPPPAPAVKASPRARVMVVPKPGLKQTYILLARAALATGHADEWRLALATTVFGGMFTSRLNMNLREDKGYTYGARAHALRGRGAGWLAMAASVQADKTGPALKEFFAEITRLAREPITPPEFTLARDGSLRSLSGAFETAASVGNTMADIFTRGLPLDRVQRKVLAFRKAKRQEAQATGVAYYKGELMQVVLVGDPEVIKKQVTPMKLGPLRTLPVER